MDEQARQQGEASRQLHVALADKKKCEDELIRVQKELEKISNERDVLIEQINQNTQEITNRLNKIETREEELIALRQEFENLIDKLREESSNGITNRELMEQIAQLKLNIENNEKDILKQRSENEELSRENIEKENIIDENTRKIKSLLEEGTESAKLNEIKENQKREEEKQKQLDVYSGIIVKLHERLKSFTEPQPKNHRELLERINIINKLLHFYLLSRTIAGESPKAEEIQTHISNAEIKLKELQENLLIRGKVCDELEIKIQELEGRISVLIEQANKSIQDIPQELSKLTELNTNSQQILEELQKIQRNQTSQITSQELQNQREQLSRELDKVNKEISQLQGLIQGRFDGIQKFIKTGNDDITTAIQTQASATLEAILTGNSKTDYVGAKLSEQSQQIKQQTLELNKLRDTFFSLKTESDQRLSKSTEMKISLENCERGKKAAEQELKTSQSLAEQLKIQLATLQADKVAAEKAQVQAQKEAQRLALAVQATASASVQANNRATNAQQSQAQVEERLRQEQQKGNPQQIERLTRALELEQQKVQQAEQTRQESIQSAQQAYQQQQLAQQRAYQSELYAYQTQGALQAAQTAQQSAEKSLETAINYVAQHELDAETKRAEQLQRLQQQFEEQCVQRVQAAKQAAEQAAQLRITDLEQRVQISEQARTAIEALFNSRIEQVRQEEQAKAEQDKKLLEAQYNARLSGEKSALELGAQQAQTILQAENLNLKQYLEDYWKRATEAEHALSWHKLPTLNFGLGLSLIDNTVLPGTTITFTLDQRGPRAVAFFEYLDKTEFVDVQDDNPKSYTVLEGLQNFGAFNIRG